MNKFIETYYKNSNVGSSIKNKHEVLKDEELYQLYKRVIKDKGKQIPKMMNIEPKSVLQCDTLYLPEDKGYKYALVVVDVATGYTDAEPLKTHNATETLTAFKKIQTREPLKKAPTYTLQCDSGTEFQGAFKTYLKEQGITQRIGLVGRSRMQSFAESRNKTIGQALFHRMTAQEILTEQQSNQWLNRLPIVIRAINEYQKEKNSKKKMKEEPPYISEDTIMLSVGTPVRVMLDKPISNLTNSEKLHGTFRATDIRWSRGISKITNVIIDDNEPIMYQIDNKPFPAYTYNQLQPVVEEKLKAPIGKHVIEGKAETYVVEAIKGRRTEKGKIQYLIEWKGYPDKGDYTWEPRTEMNKNPKIKAIIDNYDAID